MSAFWSVLRALGLAVSLMTLAGCTAIFGDFTIDDSAFPEDDTQKGPIRLEPIKGLYTTEWGGQATFTIVLDYAPTKPVTIALSSSNEKEGTLTPNSVTFTEDDWKAPQVITVTGVPDFRPDGNQAYKIITAPAVSEVKPWAGMNASDVTLVNIDNETAGVTVVPMAGLVTSEGGGQDTFTVVLNSEPKANVTIHLVSDNDKEGTVSPASLLFTPLNWKSPQLGTVTGADDDPKDPAHPYKIQVTSASEDPNYARLAPVFVEVTNQDNDSAGLSVALVTGVDPIDPTKLRTSESGDSATFTVALTVAPMSDVSIAVSSNATNEGVVSTDVLKFTPLNWNAPQTVTVTGQDDADETADGDQPYLIILGVLDSQDPEYAMLPGMAISASNVDNEKPGFTVMLLSGIDPLDTSKLLTTEAGTTASFSLALNSLPSAPVTVRVFSSMPSEGKVTPETLVFTQLNWQSPQTVSVTGVGDNIQDGSPLFYVRTAIAESDDQAYVLDPPDVAVTNQDDDSAGVQVTLARGIDPSTPNRLITEEYGSTATFTVALTSEPEGDVTIELESGNPKEGTVSPGALIFTKENYRAPQTVTITGQNDEVVVDGNQPFVIHVRAANSDDLNFNGKFASQVQVTNRDDDSVGVIVTPTAGLSTTESGGTASFTIRLQSKPAANVTINLRSSNTDEGQPNVNSVTFTPTNWNANQAIIVAGVEDEDVQDGNPSYKIILDPPQSDDPNYRNKPDPADVTLTNIDNDTAGILVSPVSGLITNEDKLKATFSIVLASKPVGPAGVNVKIQLTSSRPSEGTVTPASVTFDAVNWKSAQTVTVTGVNDDLADGSQPYMIITSVASSLDGNYNNRKPADVSVTNVDNDVAGVKIMPLPTATPTETTETSGKATFTVALNSQPSDEVTFSVTSLDTSEGTVSPATLKFSTGNWKTPQVVTVTGVNDDLADGDQQYWLRLSDGSSTDLGYHGKFGTDLPFVNTDDDHPGVRVVAAPNLTTAEKNAGTATFTVELLSQPMSSVSIGVSSSNTAEGKVSPATLSFTTGNWSMPQTVTITGVQDDVADGPQTYQVKLANAVSVDNGYNGKFATQLAVQNIDDDQPGYTVDADPALQTTEKGGQATFNVTLNSKPAGTTTVTLGLSSSNTKEGTVSPSSLVFSAANWDQPQLVTVTGVDDKTVDGDVGYTIVFAADTDYGGPNPAPVALTSIDNGLGVLVTPTMCSTTTGTTATFTLQLNSAPSGDVTISLSSDTPTMGTVSPESVTFSASGVSSWDIPQTVTVTGVSDGAYQIITSNASAPGETTGYNGFTNVADVSCTNTSNPP